MRHTLLVVVKCGSNSPARISLVSAFHWSVFTPSVWHSDFSRKTPRRSRKTRSLSSRMTGLSRASWSCL
jgi:hypothetical protein